MGHHSEFDEESSNDLRISCCYRLVSISIFRVGNWLPTSPWYPTLHGQNDRYWKFRFCAAYISWWKVPRSEVGITMQRVTAEKNKKNKKGIRCGELNKNWFQNGIIGLCYCRRLDYITNFNTSKLSFRRSSNAGIIHDYLLVQGRKTADASRKDTWPSLGPTRILNIYARRNSIPPFSTDRDKTEKWRLSVHGYTVP